MTGTTRVRIVRTSLALAMFAAATWLEQARPLREPTAPRGRRIASNVAIAGVAAACVGALQRRVLAWATALVERRRVGLVRVVPIPRWLARTIGFVSLDYTLWRWHRACHRMPALWRLHAVHHADVDLDASTALRFHPLELLASVPMRAAQVIGLGVDRATLRAWQTALAVAIVFHHANLRLPAGLDRALSRWVITPRLHGIHHSARPMRLDTNYGTLFALWDILHGTRADDLAQRDLAIGIPARLGAPAPGVFESLGLPLTAAPRRATPGGVTATS